MQGGYGLVWFDSLVFLKGLTVFVNPFFDFVAKLSLLKIHTVLHLIFCFSYFVKQNTDIY